MDLRSAIRLVRDYWRSMLALTLLGAVAAGFIVSRQTPLYSSSTTLYVAAHGDLTNPVSAYQGSLLTQTQASTYARLVVSTWVLTRASGLLGQPGHADALARRVSASVVPGTSLLTVTAVDVTARGAEDTADAVAQSFVAAVPSLEGTEDGATPPIIVSIVSVATRPTTAVSPRPVRSVGLGALVGLVVSIALAAARHSLDRRVKSSEQAHLFTGAPVLGSVPADPTAARNPVAFHDQRHRARTEAFRKIAVGLRFADIEHRHSVLLVTSASPQEGKSTTTCNLALTLARTGRRVIVLDCDLRRPKIANYLGLPAGAGLTNVLVGTVTATEAIQPWGDRVFDVLTSGPTPPNPTEMLGSTAMRALLAQLRAEYDDVLLDTAPILPVADASVVATSCDGVILVVRYAGTRHEHLREAASAMRATQTPVLGVILNRVPVRGDGQQYYYQSTDPGTAMSNSAAWQAAAPEAATR